MRPAPVAPRPDFRRSSIESYAVAGRRQAMGEADWRRAIAASLFVFAEGRNDDGLHVQSVVARST